MQNKLSHIFFDLDNTLWDFSGNSKRIVQEMYLHFKLTEKGIKDFDAFHKQYKFRNENLWNAYGNGMISREEVRLHRFLYTLDDFGVKDYVTASDMADYYIHHTRQQKDLLPGAVEILEYLRSKYALHIITNGFNEVQHFKLKNSGIDIYFKSVTTAEEAKALKPDKRIFEMAMAKTTAQADESMYIGDSPEADGAGALNAGMQFILLSENDQQPEKYRQIRKLEELRTHL